MELQYFNWEEFFGFVKNTKVYKEFKALYQQKNGITCMINTQTVDSTLNFNEKMLELCYKLT